MLTQARHAACIEAIRNFFKKKLVKTPVWERARVRLNRYENNTRMKIRELWWEDMDGNQVAQEKVQL